MNEESEFLYIQSIRTLSYEEPYQCRDWACNFGIQEYAHIHENEKIDDELAVVSQVKNQRMTHIGGAMMMMMNTGGGGGGAYSSSSWFSSSSSSDTNRITSSQRLQGTTAH